MPYYSVFNEYTKSLLLIKLSTNFSYFATLLIYLNEAFIFFFMHLFFHSFLIFVFNAIFKMHIFVQYQSVSILFKQTCFEILLIVLYMPNFMSCNSYVL